MPEKKVFDVVHPKQKETTAPATKPVRKIMLSEPILPEPGTSATPDIEEVAKKAEASIVSRQAAAIAPPTPEEPVEAKTAPAVIEDTSTPEPETPPEIIAEPAKPAPEPEAVPANVEETQVEATTTEDSIPPAPVEPKEPAEPKEVEEKPEPAEQDKVEPVKELSAIDSLLPDDSQRATAVAKENMQSPTMFDTKAYYVPIGNSRHRHGHVIGTIVAGLITAAVVAGAIYYFIKLA